MTPDQINATFEFFGAVLICFSIYRLHQDKCVRGVHPLPITFFTLWGIWNIFYYSHLEQPYSWYAGLLMVTVNTIWLGQMFYYRKN